MLMNRGPCGGKGNLGKYIERETRLCAAGLPTSQLDDNVGSLLRQYSLQDHTDALVRDAIIPPKQEVLKETPHKDYRHAGYYTEVCELVNATETTKVRQIIEDIKCTPYASFWKRELGHTSDLRPMFPKGYDMLGTTYGKKLPRSESLYDTVFPVDPVPDMGPKYEPARRMDRNYCKPPFDPDRIFGYKTGQDLRGRRMKCALSMDRIVSGNGNVCVLSSRQADYDKKSCTSNLVKFSEPSDVVRVLPKGHVFGSNVTKVKENIEEFFTSCEINPDKKFVYECLAHLNSVRQRLSKILECAAFKDMSMTMKYADKAKTGWLPKQVVYDYSLTKGIRFECYNFEPLLSIWKAFDGHNIKYETFFNVLNYTVPLPEMEKIRDVPEDCIDFRTTYREMVKEGQPVDKGLRAGLPSGRYFDKHYPVVSEAWYCKAAQAHLPGESDAWAVLRPSALSVCGVTHRDMFSPRDKQTVRRVFEAAGEKFTDVRFEEIWNDAKNYHSAGLVCFETFRRAMTKKLAEWT